MSIALLSLLRFFRKSKNLFHFIAFFDFVGKDSTKIGFSFTTVVSFCLGNSESDFKSLFAFLNEGNKPLNQPSSSFVSM